MKENSKKKENAAGKDEKRKMTDRLVIEPPACAANSISMARNPFTVDVTT